ncbi:MAG TPA: hypothetical protein VLA58_03520 [Chitinophagaceae bacterium]|nr:hypothetical protein [Chitinophagaceae bacterium]
MKYLLSISVLIIMACNRPVTETQMNGTMSGIYELRSISYKGGTMDTSFPAANQVKIYTDKYYMYGTTRPDSSAFFGFGTYLFNDTSVLEQSIFNSYALDSSSETILKITKLDTGYKQTESGVIMQGEAYEVGETYRALPESAASELDGVWEQIAFVNIAGRDTTVIRNKQFKIYKGGHFMWIHYYPAGTRESGFKKGYGFGRFTLKDNTVTEIISASNYREIIGAPISVNYTLNRDNELLLTFDDGVSVTTETYKRRN